MTDCKTAIMKARTVPGSDQLVAQVRAIAERHGTVVADLVSDLDLLRQARTDAAAWIERDPALLGPDATMLRRRLLATYGESLGLGDVG